MSILVNAQEHREAVSKNVTNGDVAREVLATPKPRLFGKKRDAAERTKARAALADPKVAAADDDYWWRAAPVSKSAFGVELGEVEKAFSTAKIGGATFTPLALGAGIGVGMRRRKKAAQGADDSKDEVEKGLGYGKLGRKASTAAKDTIKLEFKKPKPGVTPTGPGSQRGSMSASAWESRTAAARRSS